jgi:auxin responsive GH3 gene family
VEDGKSLQFIYASRQFKTKGGLTATTATTNVYRHRDFKAHMRHTQSECCSPSEVLFCPDFAESLYCHLLCGLVLADDVRTVSATFAHSLVLAFRTFERVWEELCADIRHGVPSPTRVTSPAVRRAVSALLVAPNPALADEVARRCRGLVNWRGVIPALWPRARYVSSIVTGSMEHYVKKLRHYAGALPLVALDYGATEGMIAANVEPREPPESATFAVLPNIAYFEFIPLSLRGCDVAGAADARYTEADPVGLTDVAVGEHYEVVMTTFAGLYRYRLGDVVKVAGLYNSTPKLKVVCRRNLVLSINIDKNSEHDLQLAVDSAAKVLAAGAGRLEVVDYTSHADVSRDPGHYVVFWELSAEPDGDGHVLQSCCDELDRAFTDPGYVGSRKARAIGPLELRVLRRGTFQKVLRHYLSLGSPVNQFKLPRCVAPSSSAAGVLEILAANAVEAFFSTAYD